MRDSRCRSPVAHTRGVFCCAGRDRIVCHSPRPASRFSVTSLSTDRPDDTSVRAWFGRKRRVMILAAAGLLATGAFLLWGPIGLGNGPLSTDLAYGLGAVH